MPPTFPRPPFDAWPEQLRVPGLGSFWYTAPATFVNQSEIRRATAAAVTRLHDLIDEVIATRVDDYAPYGGLLIFHDWRATESYESDARRVYLERMKSRDPGYMRGAVAVVRDTPMIRMAVQTANLVMALRNGGQLEMATDPALPLSRHGVRAPRTGGWLGASSPA